MERYKCKLTFQEPLLGTVPKNPDVYTKYILSKSPDPDEDESTTVPDEKTGWTGFHTDEEGIFLYDYQVKGFLKEVGNILKANLGIKGLRAKVENYVYLEPRKIRISKGVAGEIERPLRTSGPMGVRVALAKSDYVDAGASIEFEMVVIPGGDIKEAVLRAILDLGKFRGLGQFRTGGYGTFDYVLEKIV